jgi:hypothetical protein
MVWIRVDVEALPVAALGQTSIAVRTAEILAGAAIEATVAPTVRGGWGYLPRRAWPQSSVRPGSRGEAPPLPKSDE